MQNDYSSSLANQPRSSQTVVAAQAATAGTNLTLTHNLGRVPNSIVALYPTGGPAQFSVVSANKASIVVLPATTFTSSFLVGAYLWR